jgi:NAD(P)-dependent dehydrogenase (short-subunit alcohol dehydrogenase family)
MARRTSRSSSDDADAIETDVWTYDDLRWPLLLGFACVGPLRDRRASLHQEDRTFCHRERERDAMNAPIIPHDAFSGKSVIVTGAGRNLGAAIAEIFAAHGAFVIVADRDAGSANAVAEKIRRNDGSAIAVDLDVTDRAGCAALAKQLKEQHPPLVALVNNAGGGLLTPIDAPESLESWDTTVAVNLTGSFNMVTAMLALLRETRGSIVNVSSVAGLRSGLAHPAYAASKGGINSLTRKLARDLAPDGIRVNAVAPGYMNTPKPGKVGDNPAMDSLVGTHIPLCRFGYPAEIGGPVLFLASSAASYITGVTLPVDGGFLTV